jgi:hypothetical protein
MGRSVMKKLFIVAALYHTKVDKEKTTEMVLAPEYMLAADKTSAERLVAKKLEAKYLEDSENLEILVRPF